MSKIRSGSYMARKSEIDGWATTSRVARSCGIKCVAVQGNDTMSVVTCDNDPDIKGLRECLECILLEYIIDQINALKANSTEDMYLLGVVHMPLGPIDIVETEGVPAVGKNEEDAINFLAGEIKSKSTFTLDETIQCAILTLQILHGEKFSADDIEVSYVRQSNLNDIVPLSPSQIKEHLEKIRV